MKASKRWRIAQYFESRWWKNYLKHKDVATYLRWKKQYWEKLLDQIKSDVNLREGMQILDAGCGPAGIFIALAPFEVTAIDPLLDTYQHELAHFDPNMYPYVTFRTLPLEQFGGKEQFDLVFCLNAINHISDLNEGFLRLYSSAKKGGILVVSIDAHNHRFFKHLFRLQPADILHPHQYDLNEYEEMLTRLNCSILRAVLIKKEFLFNHYVLVARKN